MEQEIKHEIDLEMNLDEADCEAWEDELDESLGNPQVKPRPWDVLRQKIKGELKKQHKILSLSQLNQLMVLSNFATLHLKGVSRMVASAEIARQWHEHRGSWFARRVRNLA